MDARKVLEVGGPGLKSSGRSMVVLQEKVVVEIKDMSDNAIFTKVFVHIISTYIDFRLHLVLKVSECMLSPNERKPIT